MGLNEVKRHLEDFVERKLLVLVNRDDDVYRLRFPYHLSSLLVGVQDEAWAALIRLGRGTSARRDDDDPGRGSGEPVHASGSRNRPAEVRGSRASLPGRCSGHPLAPVGHQT